MGRHRSFVCLLTAAGVFFVFISVGSASTEDVNPVGQLAAHATGLCSKVKPIASTEFAGRLARAVDLLRAHGGVDAFVSEPTATFSYLTGFSWKLSERTFLLIVLRNGTVGFLVPAFEASKLNGLLRKQPHLANARTWLWEEWENPFETVRRVIGTPSGPSTIFLSPESRFFVGEGLRTLPSAHGRAQRPPVVISASDYVIDLRIRKSEAEVEIIDCANRATKLVIDQVSFSVRSGDSEAAIAERLHAALQVQGFSNTWSLVLAGSNAAFPHGTDQRVDVEDGKMLLIDTGGELLGYQSDVSRTFRFQDRLRNDTHVDLWTLVLRAQRAAFQACRPGVSGEFLDQIARDVIESRAPGFGRFFSHRLGHGIGLQGHEAPYLVKGSKQLLQEGSVFTIEPGVYIPGELGIRIEDAFFVTADSCELFGEPATIARTALPRSTS